MEVRFFLNMMGVYGLYWYEKNNIPYIMECRPNRFSEDGWLERKVYDKTYCCGRIDIHGIPEEPFGLAYGVDVMEAESWGLLQQWLTCLSLQHLPTKEELFSKFKSDTGHDIKWFRTV